MAAAQNLSPEAIVEELRLSGLRGRGGAAFDVAEEPILSLETEKHAVALSAVTWSQPVALAATA